MKGMNDEKPVKQKAKRAKKSETQVKTISKTQTDPITDLQAAITAELQKPQTALVTQSGQPQTALVTQLQAPQINLPPIPQAESTTRIQMNKRSPHDELFKSLLGNLDSAKDFLTHHLPADFRKLVDLSQITVDKESFVEPNLKKRFSDIIYKVKTIDNKDAFIMILCEHQSSVDNLIALRLDKYRNLLLEREVVGKGKQTLPLVAQVVVYNGRDKYTAPLSLWEMFEDPALAKELMGGEYKLINLQSMSDDEIRERNYVGMMEYFMKYAFKQDQIEVWKRFLKIFGRHLIMQDKDNNYLYMKAFFCYTSRKLEDSSKDLLEELLVNELLKYEGGQPVRSIADAYIDEGIQEGINIASANMAIILQESEARGEAREARGEATGKMQSLCQTALNMLEQGLGVNLTSKVTGLSEEKIKKLEELEFSKV
ncbi:MAG: transposase [Rickettsiales bacterium]|nr:MAG: transposase [Rickettsiales bacterium]